MATYDVCPHCRSSFSSILQHINRCPLNPVNLAQLAHFLRDNADDGLIMKSRDYRAAAKENQLPSYGSVSFTFGEWGEVATEFGLLPRVKGEKHTCPHCSEEFNTHGIKRHESKCPKNPIEMGKLRAFLDEVTSGEILPSYAAYDALAKEHGADVPHYSGLMRCYGTWEKTAHALGMGLEYYRKVECDKDTMWPILQAWFDTAPAPYLQTEWDDYARKNVYAAGPKICATVGMSWAEIIDEMVHRPFEIVNPEREAQEYRPFHKIGTQEKDAVARMIANIQDESERAREWFRLLGLPQPETVGEMGD